MEGLQHWALRLASMSAIDAPPPPPLSPRSTEASKTGTRLTVAGPRSADLDGILDDPGALHSRQRKPVIEHWQEDTREKKCEHNIPSRFGFDEHAKSLVGNGALGQHVRQQDFCFCSEREMHKAEPQRMKKTCTSQRLGKRR